MKKFITTLALACVTVTMFAQSSLLRPRLEITAIGDEDNVNQEVFYMADESPRVYYLSVGNLGIGSNIIQVGFDPVYELFIPLGGSLDEAIATLNGLKDFCKQPRLSTMEIQGFFSVANPSGDPVTITVTSRRRLFTKLLEFSLPTSSDGLVRATYVTRCNFRSLVGGVKFYKAIHPSEL